MNVSEAIASRRSIKKFEERPLSREEIEPLLQAATLGPNHRLTQPWRFFVLGPEARAAYGRALGDRKARKMENADAAAALREKISAEHRALPAMIAVAMTVAESPEIREEDYAAVMMGVSNLALAAVERGLGTHIKTGAIMDDPAARAALGVPEGVRIVAVVNVGVPSELPPPKERQPAAAHSAWLD
jgi:nitroreductase